MKLLVLGSAYNFIKKETLTQLFSDEFCKISKNIFSYRTPPVAISVFNWSNKDEKGRGTAGGTRERNSWRSKVAR